MIYSPARLLALLVPTAALLIAACGSDPSTTSTSGTTETSTATGATTTGATSTGAGGAGTGSTSSAGGGTSTATGTGTGTTTTTGGTGTGTGTSTGAGGGPQGACTNAGDDAIISSKDMKMIVGACGQMFKGAEPATTDCIKMKTGLSDPCVACYDGILVCAFQNCAMECSGPGGLGAVACQMCFGPICLPPFQACSGTAGG